MALDNTPLKPFEGNSLSRVISNIVKECRTLGHEAKDKGLDTQAAVFFNTAAQLEMDAWTEGLLTING